MSNSKCRICNNEHQNQVHLAPEMMFGSGGTFRYLECSRCGCLHLLTIPENLGDYYPDEYYSYQVEGEGYVTDTSLKNSLKKFLKKRITRHYNKGNDPLGSLLSLGVRDGFPWLKKGIIHFESKILDVGCGAGELLLNMRFNGFKNLSGIDPFIPEERNYQCGVTIYKDSLFNLKGRYDFIMLHHSFEHMEEPLKVVNKLYDLLDTNGYLMLNIPVADCYAWRKYGVNWVQLDAPRHIFLHTTSSIQILADQSGFKLTDILYNSTEFQFTGSERYKRGRSLYDKAISFTPAQIKSFKHHAKVLNEVRDGDTAVFYLQKT